MAIENGSNSNDDRRTDSGDVPASEPATPGVFETPANAPGHSLVAQEVAPGILQELGIRFKFREFIFEFQPAGPTEHCLVRQLGVHDAMLQLANHAQLALLQEGFLDAAGILGATSVDQQALRAIGCEGSESALRFQRRHERDFSHCLSTLMRLQAERRNHRRRINLATLLDFFAEEIDCVIFLLQRFEPGAWVCDQCQSNRGIYIASRKCWQCRGCRQQAGLRSGTVCHDSPLPLVQWFRGILPLLVHPQWPLIEVGKFIKVDRYETVISMVERIRRALASPNRSTLLAGLDRFVAEFDIDDGAESSAYGE